MATPEEKYELITRGLQEVLGGDSIKAILAEGRQPKCYWGAYSYYFQSRDNWSDFFTLLTYRNCSNGKTYVNKLKIQNHIFASNQIIIIFLSSSYRLFCCIDQNRGFPSCRRSCKFPRISSFNGDKDNNF